MDEGRIHFVGIAGTGMSALAQFLAMGGARVSGSDREFDRGQGAGDRQFLEDAGIEILPQDGRGARGAGRIVTSTAVEADIPDLQAGRDLRVPILHRSEMLSRLVAGRTSVAVAGVSGKSTVAGMLFEILEAAGRRPGLIAGGSLLSLVQRGMKGNASPGEGPLVVEADESDGTLVRYAPETGIILNLHEDHMGTAGILEQFQEFRSRIRGACVVADQEELASVQDSAILFGWTDRARFRGADWEPAGEGCRFRCGAVTVRLRVPGRHNATNALAALAAASALGVAPGDAASALGEFRGIARRFQLAGGARGVRVYDDYAHNGDKILAAVAAARTLGRRVLAVFRPHGFGPARQLRRTLIERLPAALGPRDRFDLLPIYFAGGTVNRDISSGDLCDDLRRLGIASDVVPPGDMPDRIASRAREGDVVLLMGARDPDLPALAARIVDALAGRPRLTPRAEARREPPRFGEP